MADATIYVDGTLATGADDGTSPTDAHQGVTGLQACLDDALSVIANAITGGYQVYIYIRNLFTATATILADTRSGNPAVNSIIHIIGCEADASHALSYVELTKGNYVQITAAGTDFTDTPIWKFLNVKGYEIRNVHCLNNVGSGIPAVDEDGFLVDNTAGALYGIVNFINCKVTNCSTGIFISTANSYGGNIVDFVGTSLRRRGIQCGASGWTVYGAYIEPAAGFAGGDYFAGTGGVVIDTITNGGLNGIDFNTSEVNVVEHCTLYNASSACILNDGISGLVFAVNNILMPAVYNSDYCIKLQDGMRGFIDHNLCWAVDGNAMAAEYGSQGANEFTEDPRLANVAELDFRPLNRDVLKAGIGGSPIGAVQPRYYGPIDRLRKRHGSGTMAFGW